MPQTEDLQILADCQTQQDAGSSNIPFLADNSRGRQAIVPAGKKWLVHRVEVRCRSAAAASYLLWFVPANQTVASTTTKWTQLPNASIPANSIVLREPSAGKDALAVLTAGDSIWHMGGGLVLDLYIIGWEVDA